METSYLVLTVILSSAAAGYSTYYLNVSKDRLWFERRKAEELYLAVQTLERELSNFFGTRYSLMGDNRRISEPEKEALGRAGCHLVTAKMLIGFYFPSLSSALARVIAAVTTAHNGLRAFEKAGAEDSGDLLTILDNAIAQLKDALEGLKATIIDSGRPMAQGGRFALFWRPTKGAGAGRVVRVSA